MAAMLLVACGPAWAGIDAIEMSLEDLTQVRIVSAPKFAEDPDQIPSAASILTAEDIRTYGWRTLGDALRSLQGFNVTEDHTYSYAGLRGIAQPGDYRPRMQILLDGISANDNIFTSVPLDSAFPLDIGLVERIEIIRGPSASVYGGDAMFGVINVVTRGAQGASGAEVALGAGSGTARKLRATWSGQIGNAEALLSATTFRSGGRNLNFDDLGGMQVHGVGAEDGKQLFAKVRGADWRLTLIHSDRDRTVTNGSYATIPDDRSHVESDGYTLLDLAKEWRLDAHNVLHQRLYAGQYDYDGVYPYDSYLPPDPPLVHNVDRIRGNWWGFDNRLVNTAWNGHRLTFGFEYRANVRQDMRNYDRGLGCLDAGTTTPCLDDRRHGHQFTWLAQDEIRLDPANLVTAGLRYDHLSQFGGFWSPRLGLVHDAGNLGLVKLLYGSAYRVPSVYELYYNLLSFPYGNTALQPERMDSFEFTWEKRFGNSGRLSATVYHFINRHMVSTDPAGTAFNSTPVKATGAEFEYERRWHGGTQLRAGYSVQHSADAIGRLDNSPRQMVKLNFAMPVGLPSLTAGLEGQWISRRLANYGTQAVPAYLLANLNLRYRPAGSSWEAGLGIYNLFDRRYFDPVTPDITVAGPRWLMPQLGRSIGLNLTLRY